MKNFLREHWFTVARVALATVLLLFIAAFFWRVEVLGVNIFTRVLEVCQKYNESCAHLLKQ